jgi:hypothetical protein
MMAVADWSLAFELKRRGGQTISVIFSRVTAKREWKLSGMNLAAGSDYRC